MKFKSRNLRAIAELIIGDSEFFLIVQVAISLSFSKNAILISSMMAQHGGIGLLSAWRSYFKSRSPQLMPFPSVLFMFFEC